MMMSRFPLLCDVVIPFFFFFSSGVFIILSFSIRVGVQHVDIRMAGVKEQKRKGAEAGQFRTLTNTTRPRLTRSLFGQIGINK